MLDEVFQAGDKAVIFTDFVTMARIMQEQISATTGDTPRILHGQLPTGARDAVINQFQKSEDPKSMIVSVRAGGTGIDLTAANHVFHYDRWWNPAVENPGNRPHQPAWPKQAGPSTHHDVLRHPRREHRQHH